MLAVIIQLMTAANENVDCGHVVLFGACACVHVLDSCVCVHVLRGKGIAEREGTCEQAGRRRRFC